MRWLLTTLFAVITVAGVAFAKEDLRPSKVHAKENASNKVFLCPNQVVVTQAYNLALRGQSVTRTGCTTVPDEAVVMVDCNNYNREIARILFGGHSGFTSSEQLDESCPSR
jgi:tetrahydromethanopterin S-methyltransferase subunit E